MNDLQEMFKAPRSVMLNNGEIWFVGKDIAVQLDYARTNEAITQHCLQVTEFIHLKRELRQNTVTGIQRKTLMVNMNDVPPYS